MAKIVKKGSRYVLSDAKGKRLKGQPKSGFQSRGKALGFGAKYGLFKRKGNTKPKKRSNKENPSLLILNPKSKKTKGLKIIGKVPGSLTKMEYSRTGKSKGKYFHDFKSDPQIFGLSDGSLLIRSRKKKKLFT